jgi:plastocyanin
MIGRFLWLQRQCTIRHGISPEFSTRLCLPKTLFSRFRPNIVTLSWDPEENGRNNNSPATATPSIPDAKSNKAFCIKVGTTVTFMSSSKNTGFVIDFGSSDPFDREGAIMGGADRPITVVAHHPGCYTYSVGACTAGTIYGMCGNADTQLIVSAD